MNIVVTLPKKISWESYQKELEAVEDFSKVLNFKVANFPKNTKKGEKCYLVHDGYIRGWMEITDFWFKGNFECMIKGKEWQGNFIQRSGPFNEIEPIQMTGFQGWRYFESN